METSTVVLHERPPAALSTAGLCDTDTALCPGPSSVLSTACSIQSEAISEFFALQDVCGLYGCTLSRLHKGLCMVEQRSECGRRRKKPEQYDDSLETQRRARLRAELKAKDAGNKRKRVETGVRGGAAGSEAAKDEATHGKGDGAASAGHPKVPPKASMPKPRRDTLAASAPLVTLLLQVSSGPHVGVSLAVCASKPARAFRPPRHAGPARGSAKAPRATARPLVVTTRSGGEPTWVPIPAALPTLIVDPAVTLAVAHATADAAELAPVAGSSPGSTGESVTAASSSIQAADPSGGAPDAPPPADSDAQATGGELKQLRALSKLQDFLARGQADPFANRCMASKQAELHDEKHARRGIRWGCKCKGYNTHSRQAKIQCRRCELWFHSSCEKLDYTPEEVRRLAEEAAFECEGCERQSLAEKGFDLSAGRFTFKCRGCGRTFADEWEARSHGRRCVTKQQRQRWSCACDGGKHKAGASQCTRCASWFHRSCKRAKLAAWEGSNASLCETCDRRKAADADAGPSAGADHLLAGSLAAAQPRQQVRAQRTAATQEAMAGLLAAPACAVQGTLRDGRVYVAPSLLGRTAGLGLFAGVAFRRESAVTTYDGPLLYKEQLQANQDTSYVLRVPNSGGCVIDGKLLADEIRANPANPTCDGRYYPEAGSEWMCRGTGSMCNDPRDAKLYNARITFRRPQGANKALCDLAPMRAVLVATRDLRPGEEIYFNYRSEKPFEHFKKEMQQREVLRKRNKELREVVTYVWQPDAADPACLD